MEAKLVKMAVYFYRNCHPKKPATNQTLRLSTLFSQNLNFFWAVLWWCFFKAEVSTLHFYSTPERCFRFSKSGSSSGHELRDREDDAPQLHPHPPEDPVSSEIRHQLAADLHPHAGWFFKYHIWCYRYLCWCIELNRTFLVEVKMSLKGERKSHLEPDYASTKAHFYSLEFFLKANSNGLLAWKRNRTQDL